MRQPTHKAGSRAARVAAFLYGSVSYGAFLACFLYAVGWVGNLFVPRSVDAAPGGSFIEAFLVDTLLLGIFAVQHSVMARPGFKRWWTRFVPAPVERSTYVLFSSLALFALFACWQPLGGVIWNVTDPAGQVALYGVFVMGWLTVLVTTFLINHFDLFGMRQVWLYLTGKPYQPLKFTTPGPYKQVRHPLYVGWMMAFWGTPTMTAAHLLFAVATTVYILIAVQLEERDLVAEHGERYRAYRKQVPMFIPRLVRRNRPDGVETA